MATVTVTINGMEYNLKGKEDEAYLKQLASFVEDKLQEILRKNTKLSVSAASVLTAINLADESFKSKRDLNVYEGENETLRNEMKLMNKEIDTAKAQVIESVKAKEIELNTVINDWKAKASKAIELKMLAENKVAKNNQSNIALNNEKERLAKEVLSLKNALDKEVENTKVSEEALSEITNLKEKIKELEIKNNQVTQRNAAIENENINLKKAVMDAEAKEKSLSSELSQMQLDKGKLQDQMKNLNEKNIELSNSKQKLEELNKGLETKVNTYDKQSKNLESTLASLKSDYNNMTSKISNIKSEKNSLVQQLAKAQSENKTIKSLEQKLKEENSDLKSRSSKHSLESESLRKTLKELELKNEGLEKDKKDLIQTKEQLNNASLKSKEEISKAIEEANALKQENIAIKAEKDALELNVGTLEIKGKDLIAKVEGVESEKVELNKKLSEVQLENGELKKRNMIYRNASKDVKFELQTSRYRIIDLENKFLESQINLAIEKAKNNKIAVKKNK